MCVSIEIPKKDFACFDHSQYEKEIELFRDLKQKLLKKVEKNDNKLALLDKGNNFKQFKESLRDTNENLKK